MWSMCLIFTWADSLRKPVGRWVRGYGLHQLYRKANASRDGQEVKLEAIIVAASATARTLIESKSKAKFEDLFDANKSSIGKLPEHARAGYDKLKSASVDPESVPWRF